MLVNLFQYSILKINAGSFFPGKKVFFNLKMSMPNFALEPEVITKSIDQRQTT